MLPPKLWERDGITDAEDVLRKGDFGFVVLRLEDGSTLFMDPKWGMAGIELETRTIHHISQERAGITDAVMAKHRDAIRNYVYSYNSRMLKVLIDRAVSEG